MQDWSSVISFHAFYPHKMYPLDRESDFLYNTALYAYSQPWWGKKKPPEASLRPYANTWWHKLQWLYECLSGNKSYSWFPTAEEQNPVIEKALINLVFKATIANEKQDYIKRVAGVIL